MIWFDQAVFQFLYKLVGVSAFIDLFIIFLAGYLIYILSVGFVFFIFREKKSWKDRFLLFSLATISVVLSRGIIKPIIAFFLERPRPFVEFGIEPILDIAAKPAFPSGHMAFIIPIVCIVWLLNRKLGIWYLAGALLMGISRVIIGAHWLTDILGGTLVGFISFAVVYYIFKKQGVLETLRSEKQVVGT
jgi:undecaprenyl-diphosphatase